MIRAVLRRGNGTGELPGEDAGVFIDGAPVSRIPVIDAELEGAMIRHAGRATGSSREDRG